MAKRKKKEEPSAPAESDAVAAAEAAPAPEAAPPDAAAPTEDVEPPTGSAPAETNGKQRKKGKRKTKTGAKPAEDYSEAPTQTAPPVDADAIRSDAVEANDQADPLDPSEAKTAGSSPVLVATVGDPNGEAPTEELTEAAAEVEVDVEVDPAELERTVEALLFAAEEPIAPREIARASGSDSATIRKVIAAIKERYVTERRPWDLVEVAGGFRFATRPEFYPAIQRLKTQTAQRKLTQAALETLALIAYRQPIGRAEIETVRGVNAGPVLRQLLEKKLIRITGRGTGLGQPLLYGTTDYFLEHFGLKTTQDLPKPGEFKNT